MEKTWLITGVSSGLGRLLVEKALFRGDRVVGASRSEGTLADLQSRYPQRLSIVAMDLKDQHSVRAGVDRAFAASPRIDIVVAMQDMACSARPKKLATRRYGIS